MHTIRMFPDDVAFQAEDGENILAAALRAGIEHASSCGGKARCSTCRIHVEAGEGSQRTPAEQTLADRLGFNDTLRLACQMQPLGDITVRRLVLDDQDAALVDPRVRPKHTAAGQEFELGILFADIRGFTSFSEDLPPHDVVHVLNRYFHLMGAQIERHGGRIDNYMGDGLLALFGLEHSDTDPAVNAVQAGLAMLRAVESLKPYLLSAYGRDFDMRIGIHCGDVVVGSVGAIGHERTTAIGDAVNFASRIEGACKAAGTRLLISEATRDRVHQTFQIGQSIVVPIAGKTGTHRLFEIVESAPVATSVASGPVLE